jgi:alpha-beta hydrolase superfamily lysophospholipase
LYLHGFASGPSSKKGLAMAEWFAARDVRLELLDLRVPSFERLRLSAMLETVRAAIGGEAERVVLLGSSLGGLTAARVAERDARVMALVLLAPAFRLGERWVRRLGADEVARWKEREWLTVHDHVTGRPGRVDHVFLEDVLEVDARGGGWPEVRVPTLIVHGKEDTAVEIETSRAWAAGRRWVRLVEVDDGHELVTSLPRIQAEVETFLRGVLGR